MNDHAPYLTLAAGVAIPDPEPPIEDGGLVLDSEFLMLDGQILVLIL